MALAFLGKSFTFPTCGRGIDLKKYRLVSIISGQSKKSNNDINQASVNLLVLAVELEFTGFNGHLLSMPKLVSIKVWALHSYALHFNLCSCGGGISTILSENLSCEKKVEY